MIFLTNTFSPSLHHELIIRWIGSSLEKKKLAISGKMQRNSNNGHDIFDNQLLVSFHKKIPIVLIIFWRREIQVKLNLLACWLQQKNCYFENSKSKVWPKTKLGDYYHFLVYKIYQTSNFNVFHRNSLQTTKFPFLMLVLLFLEARILLTSELLH
jgi:hypothetical protein